MGPEATAQEFVDVLCRRLTLMYLRFNSFPLGSSNRESGVAILRTRQMPKILLTINKKSQMKL